MNDTELDRILDTWQAPEPPPTLRRNLRAALPRRNYFRPLRWVLAIAAVSLTLVVATGQPAANPLLGAVNRLWENFQQTLEAWRITSIVSLIRRSNPKLYVDGQPAAPPKFTHAALIEVEIPGEGVWLLTLAEVRTWTEAGRLHGNLLELRIGARQVTIECNRPLVDVDRRVYIRPGP